MIYRLESLDDPRLAPYRDLKQRGQVPSPELFIAEGKWVVERLLDSPFETVSVVVGDQVNRQFVERIQPDVDTLLLPAALVSQLVGFSFHSGIIACGRRQPVRELQSVDALLRQPSATIVLCPHTVLPDNLGSIIRLCCGFGSAALFVGAPSANPFSRRCIRVSMGNIFRLPIVEPLVFEDAMESLQQEYGFHLLAATGCAGSQSLPMPRPCPRLAIVVGNEAHGIDGRLLAHCDTHVTIPMSGDTDSLNVAQATAVLLYQFTCIAP